MQETVVSAREDREIRKQVITPGDYNLVPYEDSRCKVAINEIKSENYSGPCKIDPDSRVFNSSFDGYILIGDSDHFIDKDFELIIQQMCCGEICAATMVYRDNQGVVKLKISCKIELKDVTDEQLISDWGQMRLYEAALHHKERGVELVKQKKVMDAFRRFNKSLKMLVAIEPVDPEKVGDELIGQMMDLKIKLYNNLAHCQLQYSEYDAALKLCNNVLKLDPGNTKALYRRSTAYTGLELYEEAWNDIQKVITLDPHDKSAQQKASLLKPKIEKIQHDYSNVIKKMFT